MHGRRTNSHDLDKMEADNLQRYPSTLPYLSATKKGNSGLHLFLPPSSHDAFEYSQLRNESKRDTTPVFHRLSFRFSLQPNKYTAPILFMSMTGQMSLYKEPPSTITADRSTHYILQTDQISVPHTTNRTPFLSWFSHPNAYESKGDEANSR